MSTRQNTEPQSPGPAPGELRVRRRLRVSRGSVPRGSRVRCSLGLALTLLVLAALFVPVGQARGSSEASSEEEAAPTSALQAKHAAREELLATRRAEREAEKLAAREQREAGRQAKAQQQSTRRVQNETRVRMHGSAQFSCTGVTWNYTGFPEGSNTIVQVVRIYAGPEGEPLQKPGSTIAESFTFVGATGETRTSFEAPPGVYKVDAWAKWKGNGLKGSFDVLGKLSCSPTPALSVEKLQKIAGTTGTFTTAPVSGQVGDTVDYEIVVTNTGNVPLTIDGYDVVDHNCTGIAGGAGSEPLEVGASTTYTCSHVLTEAGSYTNTAEVSGVPPEHDGPPVTSTSNTVLAEASSVPVTPEPSMSVEKLQQIVGAGGSYTTSSITGQVGQTVEYEIVVENTGNVPLTLSAFGDPRCDAGTISGGPEGAALPVGGSTTYTCTHVLSAEDQSTGSYANTVSVTGTPPSGGVAPITERSNTVVVEVPGGSAPSANTPEAGTTGTGSSGVLSSTFSEPSKSGVLAFSSSVPKLKGPEGCVRDDFRVSLEAKGVAKVTFYLDKRKLRTLTAKNAVKGVLELKLDPSKLTVGAHKLLATITMAATSTAKAKVASRSITVLRCRAAVLTPKFTG
jgi:hypothetical protein